MRSTSTNLRVQRQPRSLMMKRGTQAKFWSTLAHSSGFMQFTVSNRWMCQNLPNGTLTFGSLQTVFSMDKIKSSDISFPWNRKGSYKPLKTLWRSTMGVQPPCTLATHANAPVWEGGPFEFYSDLRLKYQIGAMNRVLHVVQGLWQWNSKKPWFEVSQMWKADMQKLRRYGLEDL